MKRTFIMAIILVGLVGLVSSCTKAEDEPEPSFDYSDISGVWYQYAYKCSDGYFVNIEGNGLEHVRDVFVFCCYTGLRFSDAAKLKRSDIHGDTIHVVTKKTRDALVIELNKHSRAILEKYKDAGLPDDKALPTISNVKTNAYLKNLGLECGIDEPTRVVYFMGNERHEHVFPKYQLLTTHVARRTFVVTALYLGIPAEVIMRYTGHSSFSAMKPYVAIVDELKRKSMDLFDGI